MERQQFSKCSHISELLKTAEELFRSSSSSPRLDAEVLLAHLLSISRSSLIAALRDECSTEVVAAFALLAARRVQGEPVPYITGEREFYGRAFLVNPAVLVPRPESELIIDQALKICSGKQSVKFLDLGTGSGCLAITLVAELLASGLREPHCLAVDISQEALNVAARNAERLGALQYISFVKSNWFSESAAFSAPYDLIIANPPYIDRYEKTPIELSFEPQGALFSDDLGLKDTKEIISGALTMLAPNGTLLCEVGAGKREHLRKYFKTKHPALEYSFLGDDSEHDRFTVVEVVRQ